MANPGEFQHLGPDVQLVQGLGAVPLNCTISTDGLWVFVMVKVGPGEGDCVNLAFRRCDAARLAAAIEGMLGRVRAGSNN